MTREQQIEKASIGRYPEWGEQQHALELAFQAGAMWADAHPNWISVDDELPPVNEAFVAYWNNFVIVQQGRDERFGNNKHITHWMPLPQPPKSGSSEFPNNCEKLGIKGYENVVIHEGNAKGGVL